MSPIQKAAPEDAVQGRCAAVRLAHFCRQPVSHPSAGGGDHLRIVVDAEDRTGGTSRDSQGGPRPLLGSHTFRPAAAPISCAYTD